MFTVESSRMARRDLDNVAKAASKVADAREELRQMILVAHQSGEVIRDIAEVAGISPTQVHKLIREARTAQTGDTG